MGLLSGLSSLFGGGDACRMPSEKEIFGTELTPEADAFLTACNTEFNEKQRRFAERWMADSTGYHVDFQRGAYKLQLINGESVAFGATLAGSVDPSDRSWEWAWNNPQATPSAVLGQPVLAPIGRQYDLRYLTSGFVPVPSPDFPWYLCGIAMKITGALAAQVAEEGGMEYYLLLDAPAEAPN